MFEYRVTKYDPANRNAAGVYTHDDWTSIGDIGRSFDGAVLTERKYLRVEDAYVSVATSFMRDAGVLALTVAALENHAAVPLSFREGMTVSLAEANLVVRRVLREMIWCRLEAPEGFVHFGYDYYMYVGVQRPCPVTEAMARRFGLFVEPFLSPYHERID